MNKNDLEEIDTVKGEKAFTMFCNMVEIITSTDLNEPITKAMLANLTTDLLQKFRNGLTLMEKLTDELLK